MRKEPVISIVDDDQFVRDSLKRLMKSVGYMAAAYPSAGDFLKSSQLEETSCLIADVHMPSMTGAELYEYLIKAGLAIPTILMTAYPDDRVRIRATGICRGNRSRRGSAVTVATPLSALE